MLHLIVGASIKDEQDDQINYVMTMPLDDETLTAIRQGIRAMQTASSVLPPMFPDTTMKTLLITDDSIVEVDLPMTTTQSELVDIRMNARRMKVLFWNQPVWKSLQAQGINIKTAKKKLQNWTSDDPYIIADIQIDALDGLPKEYLHRPFLYKMATATFTPWNELGFEDAHISPDGDLTKPGRTYQSTYFDPQMVLDACEALRARKRIDTAQEIDELRQQVERIEAKVSEMDNSPSIAATIEAQADANHYRR